MRSRNHPFGLATRVWRNFLIAESNPSTHVVTALATSLLGLAVVPHETDLLGPGKGPAMADLNAQGWPQWDISPGSKPTPTLGDLLEQIRHAVAHGHMEFSSDERAMADVDIILTNDYQRGKTRHYWRGRINVAQLRGFCDRLHLELERAAKP